MAVRDLAPSLLALADLVQEANDLVPVSPSVGLDIRAFDRASFDVALALQATAGVLSSDAVTAATNLITIVTSALQVIKRLRGGTPIEQTPLDDDRTDIRLPDGSRIIAARDAMVCVDSLRFRERARRFVSPLRRPGVEHLRVTVNGRRRLSLSQNDANSFEVGPVLPAVAQRAGEVVLRLQLVSPSFREANQWRMSDGAHTDWYRIEDEAFVAQVRTRAEAFRSGDALVCRVEFTQWTAPGGRTHVDRRVIEVLSHEPFIEPPMLDIAIEPSPKRLTRPPDQ